MKKLLIVFFIFSCKFSFSQCTLPFWNDVQQFKKQDSAHFPQQNQILFIGSSSFTFWKDVNDYFPGKKILNRAFGGSTLENQIAYRYDVTFPYNPKQIVLYCGENDFASSDTVTVDLVVHRFTTFYALLRARYPKLPFVYVSMKPSPSRAHLMNKFDSANNTIKRFLSTQKNSVFVDVYHAMLKPDGMPMEDIFVEDRLHMNAKGYAIWQKLLRLVLK